MSRLYLLIWVVLALCGTGLAYADTGAQSGSALSTKAVVAQVTSTPLVADSTTSAEEQKPDIKEAISKAYMNCLIEVDRSMAELMRHANAKAVRAESKSQRAFCENRKKECKETPDSAGCSTFLEEFNNIDPLLAE